MKLKSVEKLENSKVCLEIVVEPAEYEAGVAYAYKKNVGKINLPGFRKGKAPRKMIERMYGPTVFAEDAINYAFPLAYEAAVKESGIEPVEQAEIDVTEFNENTFTFKATVTVKPEVALGDYKGITAERPVVTVDDADIEAEINRLKERNSRLISVDRAAKDGDTVVIDFEGFVDGVAFDGGKSENHSLKLGSGQFIPGFEDQLVGKSAGEECDVNVTFPTEYHADDLAGKEAVFKVKVNEVKETEAPVIDDEFAKDVSEFDTLDALKKDIEEKIRDSREKMADEAFENALLDKITDNMTVEVPDVMVENQLDRITDDYANRLSSQGLSLESYLQMTGMDVKAFRDNFRDGALRQVKINLALQKIAEVENITVSDEDIDAEYKSLADQYGMDVERLRGYLPKDMMMHDMLLMKTNKFVRENNKSKKPAAKKAAAKKDDAEAEKKPAAKKSASTAKKTTAKKDDAEKKPAAKKTASTTAKKTTTAAKKPAAKKKAEDAE